MLSCKDVSRLVSQSFERKLSMYERANLYLHIAMCSTCRILRRFQILLHHAIRSRASDPFDNEAGSEARLSDSARERLDAAIHMRTKDDGHIGQSQLDG